MVDVSEKPATVRKATAAGAVYTNAETLTLVTEGQAPKGDVFTTARLAGIIAAKRTAELIPLCHPLPLTAIDVTVEPDTTSVAIRIEATVSTTGPTGVEMEALTAVSVAALTVYDMLKAADREMRISEIRLLAKSGGRSGDYLAPEVMSNEPIDTQAVDQPAETLDGGEPDGTDLAPESPAEPSPDDEPLSPEWAAAGAVTMEGVGIEPGLTELAAEPPVETPAAEGSIGEGWQAPPAEPIDESLADSGEDPAVTPAEGAAFAAGVAAAAAYEGVPDESEAGGTEVAEPPIASEEIEGVQSASAEADQDDLVARPWPGVIPTVTEAEPSRAPDEFPPPQPAIRLRTGDQFTDVVDILRRVYEGQPELASYDLSGVAADNSLRMPEIQAAAPLIPGFTSRIMDVLAERDAQISQALAAIPADASLADDRGAIPWQALHGLFQASVAPGVGLSRATKILHKKRPALIPVIDEPIVRYVLRVEPQLPNEPPDSAVRIMMVLKDDLDANRQLLQQAAEDVEDVALTPLRVLDLLIRSLS
jgi:cyclic pyranopterin monophosphate synthase